MIDTSSMIEPLDFLILQVLPAEGSTVLDAYPEGKTAKQISSEAFKGKIPTSVIGPRLTTLGKASLLKRQRGIGTRGDAIYQITPQGEAVLNTWKKSKETHEDGNRSDEIE